jgi:hypothetical protein
MIIPNIWKKQKNVPVLQVDQTPSKNSPLPIGLVILQAVPGPSAL